MKLLLERSDEKVTFALADALVTEKAVRRNGLVKEYREILDREALELGLIADLLCQNYGNFSRYDAGSSSESSTRVQLLSEACSLWNSWITRFDDPKININILALFVYYLDLYLIRLKADLELQ